MCQKARLYMSDPSNIFGVYFMNLPENKGETCKKNPVRTVRAPQGL